MRKSMILILLLIALGFALGFRRRRLRLYWWRLRTLPMRIYYKLHPEHARVPVVPASEEAAFIEWVKEGRP